MSEAEKRTAILTRVDSDVARAVHSTARRLGLSVSDYAATCLARGIVEDREAVSLANASHDAEVARLSALADSITKQSSGGRGSDA